MIINYSRIPARLEEHFGHLNEYYPSSLDGEHMLFLENEMYGNSKNNYQVFQVINISHLHSR